ncbi:MAG: hypothetical protein ONB05_10495 [candidate division KSB1 bacterium]|nr:hypothetical protein [candidate division KSB1 bacterium]
MIFRSLVVLSVLALIQKESFGGEKLYPSNFSVLKEIAQITIQRILKEAALEPNQSIVIKKSTTEEAQGWFIETQFIEVLRGGGFVSISLIANQEEARIDSSRWVLEYKIIELGIKYLNPQRWRIFGKANLQRQSVINLSVRIYNERTGEVRWAGDLREEKTDEVPGRLINELENPAFPFTCSRIPAETGWGRILEPVLILGVTGGVIYLFYSFKSK